MIKGIYQTGRYVAVSSGSPSYPNIYHQNSMGSSGATSFTGQVRYNTNSQSFEIFDGNTWQTWQAVQASVGLTPAAEAAIDWAQKKMSEEYDLKARMEKHPGLKSAWEQFKIMDALTLEEDKNDHGVQTSP